MTTVYSWQLLSVWGLLWRWTACWLCKKVLTLEFTFMPEEEPFTRCCERTLEVLHPESYFQFCLIRNRNYFFFLWIDLIQLAPVVTCTEQAFNLVEPCKDFMHLYANKWFLNAVLLTCKDKSYWGCVLLPDWQDRKSNNKTWKTIISFFVPST